MRYYYGAAHEQFPPDLDRPVGIGARDVHQRHRGRAEVLDLADPVGVYLRVRRDDQRFLQVVVGELPLAYGGQVLRAVGVVATR